MTLTLQPSLFDSIPLALPSHNHVTLARKAPATSVEAARLVWPRTGTQRMVVLTVIACHPEGMTDHEIAREAGLGLSTTNPRRGELVEQGWVVDSGERRASLGHARSIVWVLSEAAERKWGSA